MYSSIKTMVSFVLIITSITLPIIVKAADDENIQTNIYKLNEDIIKIIGNSDKVDIESKKQLYALADQSEIFDWDAMTCHVISGKNFQMATPEQKGLLRENFKNLFISAYAGLFIGKPAHGPIFSSFSRSDPVQNQCGYEISGKLQADFEKAKDEPQENTAVYLLSKSKFPEVWRLIDVKAMGIDLLETYNMQFKDEIRSNGLNGLIEKLQVKNSR